MPGLDERATDTGLGRWTIRVCKGCGEHLSSNEVHGRGYHDDGSGRIVSMPVVPADEPAAERLAQHLYDTDAGRSRVEGPDGEVLTNWPREPDGYKGMYRDRARECIRVLAMETHT